MLLPLIPPVIQEPPSTPTIEFRRGSGLTIRYLGVPVVQGSWFQVYAPGWTAGYYSSTYGAQTVEQKDGTIQVRYENENVKGENRYEVVDSTVRVTMEIQWKREGSALVEFTPGMVWVPAVQEGTMTVGGAEVRALADAAASGATMDARRLGDSARSFAWQAPFARFSLSSTEPLIAFDARNYAQSWAENRSLLWIGGQGLEVAKDRPARLTMEWRFEPSSTQTLPEARTALRFERAAEVLVPDPRPRPIIASRYQEGPETERVPLGDLGGSRAARQLRDRLARRFELAPTTSATRLDLRQDSEMGDAFQLGVTDEKIEVRYGTESARQVAFNHLVSLARVEGGRLVLPKIQYASRAEAGWRGVHLFVGPQARRFQNRLWERVLGPAGLNEVVLQCERTDWPSAPEIRTRMTMPLKELQGLFSDYRRAGVEPIPLIQSWGHMEWLFANRMNFGLVYNRSEPYAINPDSAAARQKLRSIWEDAARALRPRTIHFGLDEVDMIGGPADPKEVTRLWQKHLPWLGELAEDLGVNAMLWGDKALAPGEAPDAAHGHTLEDARARRTSIPRGFAITDWHYLDDPNPERFAPSLDLWKREGRQVIASTWYLPENIEGFGLAAVRRGAGILQTTWAGYESNEAAMLAQQHQFSAMLLAAHVAWTGEPWRGSDPMVIFRQAYYGQPRPVRPRAGWMTEGSGLPFEIEGVRFRPVAEPIGLGSRISLKEPFRPAVVLKLETQRDLRRVYLAGRSLQPAEMGEVVATIEWTRVDGKAEKLPIRYGCDVRALGDLSPTWVAFQNDAGTARWELAGGVKAGTSVTVRAVSSTAGLRIEGVSALDR